MKQIIKLKQIQVLIVSILVVSLWMLISEILILYPQYKVNEWEENKRISNLQEWESVLKRMKIAHQVNPFNPKIKFMLGSIYEWRTVNMPLWDFESRKYRREAIVKYREVTRLRPTWSIAWVSTAQNKFLLQEFDQEMISAFRLALKFGKWDMQTHRKLVWLGIASWDLLPREIKDEFHSYIKTSLMNKFNSNLIIDTAVRYAWEKNIDNFIDTKQKLYLNEVLIKMNRI